jgi:hypothetical protein
MRTTAELVSEMRMVAKNAWLAAIAVGFENDTKFVFNTSPYALEELNNLVKQGGSPIGILRFEKTGTSIQGMYRPFVEYEDQTWAREYLAGLLENAAEIIALGQNPAKPPVAY